MSSNPRLFIDHTHTTASGYKTGVQRVVRNICEHAVDCRGLFQQVIPVQWSDDAFMSSSVGVAQDRPQSLQKNSRPSRLVARIGRWVKAFGKVNKNKRHAFESIDSMAVDFKAGDVLLLPDAYWAFPGIWPTVQKLREIGVRTAVVIYDLIPHTHAEIYGQQGAEGFRTYVRQAYQHADCLLAISDTVRQQLLEHLPVIVGTPTLKPQIRSFQLGADFVDRTGPVRDELISVFSMDAQHLPYLMVGTIEARKNHSYSIDAMEQLWLRFPNRRLCIVGQVGWKGESVINRITSHSRYQKELFWFQNASDAEVLYCYRHAKGVIFPSLTEGFGLPIVEALWHQKETLASDIPIHRETGKDLCRYFSLEHPSNLVSLLIELEGQATSSTLCKTGSIVAPWSVAVSQLIETIHQCVGNGNGFPKVVSRSAA